MTTIRVAAVQAEPVFLDLAGTLDKLDHWARRAAKERAVVVAFPETWLPGYPAWIDSCPEAAIWGHDGAKTVFGRLFENAVDVPSPATARIGALARELGVTLVVGAHERAGKSLYNALLTFTPDGVLANHHRKLVPTYTERMLWGHGDGHGLRVVDAGGLKLGGLVCWEHWMPLARQALHDSGEDIHVALWPTVHEMHQVASRHYAFEGRCFVLAAGSLLRMSALPRGMDVHESHKGEWALRGGSMIVAPDGRVLAGPVLEREDIVAADLDLSMIREESMTLDVTGHYSRPDSFEFRAIRHPRAS